MRRNIETQIKNDQSAVAQTYAGLVDEYLTTAITTAAAFSANPIAHAPLQIEAIQPALKGVAPDVDPERRAAIAQPRAGIPRIQTILTAAPNGEVYFTDPPETQKTLPTNNLGTREYYQTVIKTGKPAWSDVIIGSSGALTSYVAPIKDAQGKTTAIHSYNLALNSLADTAKQVNLGDEDAVLLIDTQGVAIVHPYGDAVTAGKPLTDLSVVSDALASKTGAVAFTNRRWRP